MSEFTKPKRPVEPYSWNPLFFSEELLGEWKKYIEELEDYVESRQQPEKTVEEVKDEDIVWGIFYRESFAKTIYVKAPYEDDARAKAEKYFKEHPLSTKDFNDRHMTVYTCPDELIDEKWIEEI